MNKRQQKKFLKKHKLYSTHPLLGKHYNAVMIDFVKRRTIRRVLTSPVSDFKVYTGSFSELETEMDKIRQDKTSQTRLSARLTYYLADPVLRSKPKMK